MDRMIYTAASGASALLEQQAIVANNIANASTVGFRSDRPMLQTFQVAPGSTRASVAAVQPAVDLTPGAIQQTGNALDIAVQGDGFIAVQAGDGSEAYTRAGNLTVGPDGTLSTQSGLPVMGDGGPIAVPPDTTVSIAKDGTVSAVPSTPPLKGVTALGRIKLVNPPVTSIAKGPDGLFRMTDGSQASLDETVKVVSGAVESSNVSPAEALVSMIDMARTYEMHMKTIQSAQDNAQHANELLSING